ncbi:MAG: hypothetical protein V4549_18870 [Bacteroidota bacterium]
MNFTNLKTYNDSNERAFEALCNQLFERWIRKEYDSKLKYFTTVNGAGGDGGVEAYAIINSGDVIGVQAKWFRTSLSDGQIGQIRKSINSARSVRANIKRYIVCLPRDFQSDKIGKGKKLITDSEEKRINELIDEMDKSYPDLKLEFWNEHRIREELQKPGNEGVLRFWFEKEELSIEFLKQKFDLTKAGWLKERYTPSLHCQGTIQGKIEEVLFTPIFRENEIKSVEKVIKQTLLTNSTIEEFNRLAGGGNEFEADLNSIKTNLNTYHDELLKILESIKNGEDTYKAPIIPEVDIWPVRSAIQQKKLSNNFRNLQPKLIRALEKTHQVHLGQYIYQVPEKHRPHNFLILGGPGTGKTHGVAKAVENRLTDNLPAIIIRAKGTPIDNWASILHSTLGGLNDWSDEQIFSGLEALAIRADQYRALAGTLSTICENEPTKILICIDGVDEAEDAETWKIRINETTKWINQHPRLRFIVTSRQYVPYNMNPCDLDFDHINRRFDLLDEGDVSLHELVPKYLEEYNINYENAPWIIGAFGNALSLKLFCEEYKGQNLSSLAKPVTLGLGALLNAKIQRIENEFFEKLSPDWSKTDQVIKKALFHIAEALQNKSYVEHETLCKHLAKEFDGLIDRNWAAKLLDTFANHGVILKREQTPDDGISLVKIDYTAAYQSYLDYFIAIKATQEIVNSGKKNVPDLLKLKNDWNSFRLTAISLLNDHNILIGENGYWVDDFDAEKIRSLKFGALNNASDQVISGQIPAIKDVFLKSIEQRNAVLFQFIIPNLYRKELNLGIDFLHDSLIKFQNAFDRDTVWSSPDKFEENEHLNIGAILLRFQLHPYHKYNELPIVFVWSLTSTNNVYREHCRSQLTRWGYHNPKEFIEILGRVFFCGDPQVQEDLANILLGIASLITKADTGLKELAAWVNANIFADDKIILIRNSVVRHSARALVERAFALNECDEPDVKKARPPYKTNNDLLPLDIISEGNGRGERFPIVHDLAWYVIEKSSRGFLDYKSGKKTNTEGEELIQKYRDKYNTDFGPFEFTMSAGIAFIKNLGWNRENGPGMTEATHGSKSKFATFEEKYTWLAVHEIQGYLADLVPFKNDNEVNKRVLDYNLLIHVPNPAKDYLEDPKGPLKPLKDSWYVPDDISPILTYTEVTLKSDVETWVNRKDVPKFSSWINVDGLRLTGGIKSPDKWLSLYMDTDLSEPNNIGRTALELVCCLIKKDKFESFLKYFKGNIAQLKGWPFDSLDHFEASPKCNTYSSVKDIVWMNWIEEDYSDEVIEKSDTENFTFIKTVTQVIENTMDDGEDYFKIPSKYVRQSINIVDTDKERFFDDKGELSAIFYKHGKPYHDTQKFLIVDKSKFYNAIAKDGLMPFWIAFQIQNTTLELKREHKDFHSQNCRLWLVWEENGVTKELLYQDGPFTNK